MLSVCLCVCTGILAVVPCDWVENLAVLQICIEVCTFVRLCCICVRLWIVVLHLSHSELGLNAVMTYSWDDTGHLCQCHCDRGKMKLTMLAKMYKISVISEV
jgi:hypothetical protein